MRLFITGATGLIGRRLVLDRLERGDRVVLVTRNVSRAVSLFAAEANANVDVVEGNVAIPGAWQRTIHGCDAVIHLAGAGIADRRWDARYKRIIYTSRVDGTHQVVEAIAGAAAPPRVLISASAVGIYGETGEAMIDERTEPTRGDFLADLCFAWEREASKAADHRARVAMLRFGAVLDPRGGALHRLIPIFRTFLGGPIGSGRQYAPWIHWRDAIGLIDFALRTDRASGPINAVAPEAVTNRAWSRALAHALGRPSWLPVPRFGLRLALGEVATYVAMSQRVVPARALEMGYRFVYPEIEAAMEQLIAEHRNRNEKGAGAGVQREAAVLAARSEATAPAAAVEVGGPVPEQRIRLVAIGVGGVLLRDDGKLPQSAVHACRAAQRDGCVIVLATARPPRSIRSITEALGLISPSINYNGALIWNPLDGRDQYHEPMDGELAHRIVSAAREVEPDVLVGLEILDRWFTDRIRPDLVSRSGAPMRPDGIGPLEQYLASPVTQLELFGTASRIAAVRAVIEERFWKRKAITLWQPEPTLLQISHPLVDKGIALQRIANRMGVDRAAVMAIGDGQEDTGMVGWAGFGVAVANGSDRVRAVADVVVASNEKHGVARAIQRYVIARK